jgi:cell division protein FtsI/penicillin-binding protein 2
MTWNAPIQLWAPTLFDQSVAKVLQRNFPEAQYVLMAAVTEAVLDSRWTGSDLPALMGSLVKPFTALAAGSAAAQCDSAKCWFRAGHGRVGLKDAIAHSCNSYFLQVSANIAPARLQSVAQQYGLPMPDSISPAALTGMGREWRIAPIDLAKAYSRLAFDSEAAVVREGMRASAREGTAKAIRIPALAKTGTAPCSHARKAPIDGYVAVLYPADVPKYMLLVQVHGVTGAVAAGTAARMLTVLRDGK